MVKPPIPGISGYNPIQAKYTMLPLFRDHRCQEAHLSCQNTVHSVSDLRQPVSYTDNLPSYISKEYENLVHYPKQTKHHYN